MARLFCTLAVVPFFVALAAGSNKPPSTGSAFLEEEKEDAVGKRSRNHGSSPLDMKLFGDFLPDNGNQVHDNMVRDIISFSNEEELHRYFQGSLDCINKPFSDGSYPITYACRMTYFKAIRYFISQGVDLNVADCLDKMRPLELAIESSCVGAAMILLEGGAEADYISEAFSITPLELAYQRQQLIIFEAIGRKTKMNQKVWQSIVSACDLTFARTYWNSVTNTSLSQQELAARSNSFLYFPICTGQRSIVRFLLHSGANPFLSPHCDSDYVRVASDLAAFDPFLFMQHFPKFVLSTRESSFTVAALKAGLMGIALSPDDLGRMNGSLLNAYNSLAEALFSDYTPLAQDVIPIVSDIVRHLHALILQIDPASNSKPNA